MSTDRLNLLDFGAKEDWIDPGSGAVNPKATDNTPFLQAAVDYASASGGRDIFIPNGGRGYLFRGTVKIRPAGALDGPADPTLDGQGLSLVGEGGEPIGGRFTATTLADAAVDAVADDASIGSRQGAMLAVAWERGITLAAGVDEGRFLRLVGAFSHLNVGRFCITKVLSATSCLVYNELGVPDDANSGRISATLEGTLLSVRASSCVLEKLAFIVHRDAHVTTIVDFTSTASRSGPLEASHLQLPASHLHLSRCLFTTEGWQASRYRYGVKCGDLVVTRLTDPGGVPVPQPPGNVDFLTTDHCQFEYAADDGAGVYVAGVNAGNEREHKFYETGFAHMAFGFYVEQPLWITFEQQPVAYSSSAAFLDCTFEAITDTAVTLGAGDNVSRIVGGTSERVARIVNYPGTAGNASPFALRDHSYECDYDPEKWPAGLHPSRQVATFGGLGPTTIEGCSFNLTNIRDGYVYWSTAADLNAGIVAVGNAFYPTVHTARPAVLPALRRGPFPLSDGMTLNIQSKYDGEVETVTFRTGQFADISRATAREVAAQINAQCALGRVRGWGTMDEYLFIESLTPGVGKEGEFRLWDASGQPHTAGSANAVLLFSDRGYLGGSPQTTLSRATGGFLDCGAADASVLVAGNVQAAGHRQRTDVVPPLVPTLGAVGAGRGRTALQLLAVASLSGVVSGGAATAPGANLRGSARATGTDTVAVWAFAVPEPDASYFVQVTPTTRTGSPSAGSSRVVGVDKGVGSVTVRLEAAPGPAPAGQTPPSQSFDILLLR